MANETLPLFPSDTSSLLAEAEAISKDSSEIKEEMFFLCPDDMKDGDMRGVEYGDFGICLSKVGGRYYAIEDSCNHSGALLSGGYLDGCVVTCPRHFLRFSVVDGVLQTKPKICDPQKVYDVRLKDGGVHIVKRTKNSLAE